MSVTLEVDKESLNKLLKRFDNMPTKLQKSATQVVLTAGAKVVKNNAKAKAPACLKSTIRTVKRKTSKKLVSKLSVAVGRNPNVRLGSDEMGKFGCYPAMWVEFGTYNQRKWQSTEPYAPATLKRHPNAEIKNSYPSARWLAMPPKPFLRPAIDDPNIEKAMAKRLRVYMEKKGF